MSYLQMVTLTPATLRGPIHIEPLGNERDIEKIGNAATVADGAATDATIAKVNARAAAFHQKLEAVLAGDILDVSPSKLKAENLEIRQEAVAAIEKRNEVRKRIQTAHGVYRAARKEVWETAQAGARQHADALVEFPAVAGIARRDELVRDATIHEFAAYQWEPLNLFRHHDEKDLALAKMALGLALLDAAGLAGAVALPAQVALPA